MTEETPGQEPNEEQPLTEAQIKEAQERMKAYYTEQISILELRSNYEKLLADIEENRARRVQMSIRIAQMMAGPKEEKKPEENNDKTSKS